MYEFDHTSGIYDTNGNEYSISSVDGSCYNTIRDGKLFTNMDVHIVDNKTKTNTAYFK